MVSEETKELLESEFECFKYEYSTSVHIEFSNRDVKGYFIEPIELKDSEN
jgi:hypothetical protein